MDEVKPTARWANRTLRPLVSVYRRLEKHHETLAIIASDLRALEREANVHTQIQSSSMAAKAQDWDLGSDADQDDPVWVPGKKPDLRRLRHRYSTRNEINGRKRRARHSIHSPEVTRILPGAIDLATPVISGKQWEAPMSVRAKVPSTEAKSCKKSERSSFLSRRSNSFHRSASGHGSSGESVDTELAGIVQNFEHVFGNFLRNTCVGGSTYMSAYRTRCGTRSLMATAIRRLPAFIQREQDIQDEQDVNADEDMCDAYFTELESFYAPHGQGWKPLREAVRAQGIFYVSNMIRNNWLTDAIVGALIERCQILFPDVSESLLSIFLSTLTSYPHPSSLNTTGSTTSDDSNELGDPLRVLRRYKSVDPSRPSYLFHELANVLTRGVLPAEWMATKSWTMWMTRATISFSSENEDCAAASRLIEAVLLSAADILPVAHLDPAVGEDHGDRSDPAHERQTRHSSLSTKVQKISPLRKCPLPVEDALNNQVTSLLAAICGMHIARSRDTIDPIGPESTKAGQTIICLRAMLDKAIEVQPLSHVASLPSYQLLRRGSMLLADYLVYCNDLILQRDCQRGLLTTDTVDLYCEMLAARSELVKELASFCRQVFRCFGRSTETASARKGGEIRRMISQLSSMSASSALTTLLGRVAIEAAMEFAENTGEPDDHVWAIEVQEKVLARLAGKTSRPGSWQPGFEKGCYRWEESIGEWIARTPAVKVHVPPVAVKGSFQPSARPMVNMPCLEDRSSQASVRDSDSVTVPETPSSSFTSPPSASMKRTCEEMMSSPLPVTKRPRAAPVIVNDAERNYRRRSGYSRTTLVSKSPPVEQASPRPRRRILHDGPSRLINRNERYAAKTPNTKVEVVIFNNQGPKSSSTERGLPLSPEPDLEVVDKRPHRAVARRRSTRSRLSVIPDPHAQVPRRRSMVIPCSDEDSDDELSFL